MKQPEDIYTMDMLSNETLTPSKEVTMCSFHISTCSGEVVEWRGLTMRQAKAMYAATEKHLPDNVKSYGWEVAG